MNKTEHQSMIGGPHPDEWKEGSTCEDCGLHLETVRLTKFNKGPGYNLAWLLNSNESGDTAMSMVKEMEEDARETGRDIRHVGGSSKAKKERNERLAAEREAGQS